jgi:phosphoglycolate phosphatase
MIRFSLRPTAKSNLFLQSKFTGTYLKNRMKIKNQNRAGITKVVAFDCDGVMFDSTESNKAYYNQVLAHFGKPELTAEQFAFTHMHTADDSMAYLFRDDERLQEAQAYRRQMTYMPFIRHMEMEPHLKPLLIRLRNLYRTAIASNRTDTMTKVLEVHGLENDFDFVVSALDVRRPKPYPDQLFKIMDYFKVAFLKKLFMWETRKWMKRRQPLRVFLWSLTAIPDFRLKFISSP